MMACDFFAVETIWLKTIYLLFFIEPGTRRIHLEAARRTPRQSGLHSRDVNWCGN